LSVPIVLTNVPELGGNPYVRLWNAAVERSGARLRPLERATVLAGGDERPAWVHLQWPERVLRHPGRGGAVRNVARLAALLAVARARGARVMVTVHNVWSHDGLHPRLERLLWRVLGALTTDLHLLCGAGRDEVLAAHPGLTRAARHVIPLGDYAPMVQDPPGRSAAREALGLPPAGRVFIVFGLLKPYKGVEELVAAFRRLEDPGARLLVAGRVVDAALEGELAVAAREDPRVVLLTRFLPDAELAAAIRAADCVVLPYRRVLNSGSALLALGLGRPVLLPATPTFAALRRRVGEAWVATFTGALDADDLARMPASEAAPAPDLSWCSWAAIEQQLAELWPEAVAA
jgi:beta-1,4-mannosyltransferase